MKEFFGIESNYKFEWADLSTVLTILNVTLIIMGYWWAPLLGLLNCVLNITISLKNHVHVNFYITQVALLILNIFFLKG